MWGFHQWLKADRIVRKGQKGIRLTAPVMDGADGGKVVNIKPAWVFGVSQTDELIQHASAQQRRTDRESPPAGPPHVTGQAG